MSSCIKSRYAKSKHLFTTTLALLICAGVLFFPMAVYAYEGYGSDEGSGSYADGDAYDYSDDFGSYADGEVPFDISAISASLDFTAILAAIMSGALEIDPAWLELDWFVPDTQQNLTPDGTGTVIDNIFIEGNGLEFFTFTTAAGNVFYLVIDRTRDSNNVFFLNAVNEWSLLALAEAGGGTPIGGSYTISGIPSAPGSPGATPSDGDGASDADDPGNQNGVGGTSPAVRSGGNGTIIFIFIAAAVFGGLAYYLKIIRPKQQAAEDDEDFDDADDDYEDDDYLSYGSDSHAGDDSEDSRVGIDEED